MLGPGGPRPLLSFCGWGFCCGGGTLGVGGASKMRRFLGALMRTHCPGLEWGGAAGGRGLHAKGGAPSL